MSIKLQYFRSLNAGILLPLHNCIRFSSLPAKYVNLLDRQENAKRFMVPVLIAELKLN